MIEEEKLKLVRKNGLNIRDIDNPSEEVQLEAVKQNGYAIQFIENPSKEAQELAIINSNYHSEIFKYCPDFKIEDFKDEILIKGLLE